METKKLCPFSGFAPCYGKQCILFDTTNEDSVSTNCMLRESCRWLIANKNLRPVFDRLALQLLQKR